MPFSLLPLLLLPLPALATTGFDPTSSEDVFNGTETYTEDGTVHLWAEIARYRDPDTSLFGPVTYNSGTAWPSNDAYAPWIATCFGSTTPDSGTFLLHVGPDIAGATGTPILFIPGAGDNASRGFITMASHFDYAFRPVFAVTFPHPHGDVFQQAELVADAVAVVKARTGADVVDVVSHSKGGIATALYLSNEAATTWGSTDTATAYGNVGTAYDGSVRRAVFIATPLGGIDTAYRWSSGNEMSLEADTAYAPASWSTYYPYTTSYPTGVTSLKDQDFLPDGDDLFPGQRQLLARQDYTLPGEMPRLGTYAMQQDWYTTYEGGTGFYSKSDGIDDAITAGGSLIDTLHAKGVDPSVEIYLTAGENPLMPASYEGMITEYYGSVFADALYEGLGAFSAIIADAVADSLISVGISSGEVQGLASGALVLGEITGPSDGLVFVTSALDQGALTARGAVIHDSYTANLSHLDLLYASPITGQLLIDDAGDDETKAWEIALGERYTSEDSIGKVDGWLADPSVPDTGGDSGGDTDDSGPDDTGVDDSGTDDSGPDDTGDTDTPGVTPDDDEYRLGCGTCSSAPQSRELLGAFGLLAGLVVRRRRR